MSKRSPLAVLRWWNWMPYQDAPPRSKISRGASSPGTPSSGDSPVPGYREVVANRRHLRTRRRARRQRRLHAPAAAGLAPWRCRPARRLPPGAAGHRESGGIGGAVQAGQASQHGPPAATPQTTPRLHRPAQPLQQRERRGRLVHRVEMQARRTAVRQPLAQVGHHVEPEGPDRRDVVAVSQQPQPDPARDFGAAGIREAHQLRRTGDRHDAGHDRHVRCPSLRPRRRSGSTHRR